MAITVNSEIKRILREKEAGIRTGVSAMRDVLTDLHRQVLFELGKAAVGSWNAYQMKKLLNAIELEFSTYAPRAGSALSVGLEAAWAGGLAMVEAPLAVAGIYAGGFHLGTQSLDALKDYANDYLQSALGDAWIKVKGEINLGVLGGKSPAEVAKAIGNTIDSGKFGNTAYRAETIAKTEMGRIFSIANDERINQAAETVKGLEKQWMHRGHPKQARPSHVAAHGQHVAANQSFNIGGVMMRFPRDPGASLSETMHCGCDQVPYMERWAA